MTITLIQRFFRQRNTSLTNSKPGICASKKQ